MKNGGHVKVDEKSRVAMLTAKCAANWFAKRDGAETVADWVRVANRRSYLEEGDLILSTRGTVGNCAVVVAECLPAIIDQDVARISLYAGCEFSPQYLLSYLNSRFGQDHIQRFASGMVQQGLLLAKVREIPVPCISEEFQRAVQKTVFRALEQRRLSTQLLDQAETCLLSTLGLADWSPPEPLSYSSSAVTVRSAARLDAEYFMPAKTEVADALSAMPVT